MSRKIKFREDWSTNERVFEKMLLLKGIKYKFEPHTIDLIPSAEGTLGRIKPTQYTPDFGIEINDRKIIIETKGFLRGRDAIINKLADIYYTERGFEFYVIKQTGLEKHGNKNYYLYSSNGIARRGQKTRTFWELIGASSDKDDEIYKLAKLYVSLDIADENGELEDKIKDLETRRDAHLAIVEEGKFSTKKYQEANRKLKDVRLSLLQIQQYLQDKVDNE